jgi:hypothetical protein
LISQNASLAAPCPEITFLNQTPEIYIRFKKILMTKDHHTWSLAQALSSCLVGLGNIPCMIAGGKGKLPSSSCLCEVNKCIAFVLFCVELTILAFVNKHGYE